MVVVMKERATEAQIDAVIARLIELGMDVHRSSGATRTVLGVVGAHKVEKELIELLDGVHEVLRDGGRFAAEMGAAGNVTVPTATAPEEFGGFVQQQIAFYRRVAKQAGIEPQ